MILEWNVEGFQRPTELKNDFVNSPSTKQGTMYIDSFAQKILLRLTPQMQSGGLGKKSEGMELKLDEINKTR
ncbi:MAG: hypothetical protein IPG90_08485 [Bacteroidetes bacterium]|nr:hypothetical protein [Bacteroidota bacterium]